MRRAPTRFCTGEGKERGSCSERNPRSFLSLAKALHIMTDDKAGVYRTAYMKVIAVKYEGTQLYLVPGSGPNFDYVNQWSVC